MTDTMTPAQERMAKVRAARGRMPRAQAVATERRRRTPGTLNVMNQFKLDIFHPSQLDPTMIYRWITDEGNRIAGATQMDDYDLVKPVEIKGYETMPKSLLGEGGDTIRTYVETNKGGQPIYAYLCRKPRAYWEADNAENQERFNAKLERRVVGGEAAPVGPTVEGAPAVPAEHLDGNFYASQGNKLSRVSRAPA